MKIKFTHDFRGKLTDEVFYLEGTELEIDADAANELIALGHAVAVETPKPKPRKVPKPLTEKAVKDGS
jgi:hypothetical protein